MADLTTEYLDKKLEAQTKHFDHKLEEHTEHLARMVNTGFDEVYRRLDVRERLEKTERDVEEIKRVLKLA